MTARSATESAASTSASKSGWPGVSSRLTRYVSPSVAFHSNEAIAERDRHPPRRSPRARGRGPWCRRRSTARVGRRRRGAAAPRRPWSCRHRHDRPGRRCGSVGRVCAAPSPRFVRLPDRPTSTEPRRAHSTSGGQLDAGSWLLAPRRRAGRSPASAVLDDRERRWVGRRQLGHVDRAPVAVDERRVPGTCSTRHDRSRSAGYAQYTRQPSAGRRRCGRPRSTVSPIAVPSSGKNSGPSSATDSASRSTSPTVNVLGASRSLPSPRPAEM